jgi:hypothetical protein
MLIPGVPPSRRETPERRLQPFSEVEDMEWVPGLRVGPIEFGAMPDPIPESWRELMIRRTDRNAQRGSPSDFASIYRSHYRSHRVEHRCYTIDELQVVVGLEDGEV